MRIILASSLLIALAGSANAATVHHAHRQHVIVRPDQGGASDPASAFGYAPSGPAIYRRSAPYGESYDMYPGGSQGYAPGEREQFIDSVRQGG